ncbi:MAG: Stk1 family PASTA domain-containing Ser/Thr kinase [Nocardioidaceae bacterium]
MTTDDASRLGDRYEVGGLLGRGGMADVRIGQDLRLGRTVAIKRLRSDLASDPTFLARFRREAQSAASLNHPAIVAVYDTGEDIDDDGKEQPYIVMEYVEGRTLRDILREGRKILPERALEITADVLSALDYSHRAGIVHRDIKPANVMLTPAGQVKVMDFGIARAIADASSAMTQTAAVVGTAQYLSPEQARGEQVDARSDLYSTGCLLYELLTFRPPFVGDSPVSVAYQHVREEAERPSHYNPEIPELLDAIVAKALAKRTDDRYQSAAEMRADIERFLAGQPIAAPAVAAAPTAVAAAAALLDEGSQTSFLPLTDTADEEPSRRARGFWILLVVLLVALIVAGAVAATQLLSNDEPRADVSVPDVVTMTEDQARREIQDAGLTVGNVDREVSADVAKGRVIDQDPDGGGFLFADDPIDLVVSAGPAKVEVPNLLDQDRADARQALLDLGLRAQFELQESDEPRGTVLASDPVAGTPVAADTVVILVVSEGLPLIPNVIGSTEAAAEAELEAAGFEVSSVESTNTKEPAGTVIDQAPDSGERAPSGTTVVITVSGKVEETTPPPTTDPTTPPPTTEPTTPPPTTEPPTKPTTDPPTEPPPTVP